MLNVFLPQMRSYLCVALTVLVLAADHTLASDTPPDKAETPPMMTLLKVSKEKIIENRTSKHCFHLCPNVLLLTLVSSMSLSPIHLFPGLLIFHHTFGYIIYVLKPDQPNKKCCADL